MWRLYFPTNIDGFVFFLFLVKIATAPILTLLGLLYFSNTSVQQKHDIYMTTQLSWLGTGTSIGGGLN
jgi:hypothetical protein